MTDRLSQLHPAGRDRASQGDEAVALFRYGLIADLLHLPPGHRTLHALAPREKADRDYEIPRQRPPPRRR